jgi:hypothetical protein
MTPIDATRRRTGTVAPTSANAVLIRILDIVPTRLPP